MGQKMLMKGNEAIAEAAIQAGLPLLLRLSHHPPESDTRIYVQAPAQDGRRCFLQAESEVAAINMVYGAAGAGVRVHDQLLLPGHLPEAGGHQLYRGRGTALRHCEHGARRPWPGRHPARPERLLSRPPGAAATATTACWCWRPPPCRRPWNLTQKAFDLADKYRNPVLIMGDGTHRPDDGARGSCPITSRDPALPKRPGPPPAGSRLRAASAPSSTPCTSSPSALEQHMNERYAGKYAHDGAERVPLAGSTSPTTRIIVLVAYGTTARIARTAMRRPPGPRASRRA